MSETPAQLPFDREDSSVGKPVTRVRARRVVAGHGTYTDDITLPRMVHAAFVRSPYAHAQIVSIDTSEAEKQPGVVKVATGADVAKLCTPWVGTLTSMEGMKAAPQDAMAVDRACWQGEQVVIVVAQTRAQAEDAAELVQVEYRELPAAVDKDTALDPETPVIHPDLGDNLVFRRNIDTGDCTAAFAAADHVVEEEFLFGRHTGVTLEPRALVADYDAGTEELTIYTSSQVPHMIRAVFAKHLGLKEHNVRVIAPDVGGSFGLKIHTYGDEVAAAAMAIALKRPVKFIADRLESFATDIHAREHRIKARMAVTKDGDITAVELDDLAGVGAYSQYPRTSAFEAHQVLNITAGPYKHENYRAEATVVYLNKVPTSQYRAVGHPIGITVAETLVDMAAAAVGMDPIEFRRHNVMADDSYPRITASGLPVQDLSHQRCIDTLVQRMNYAALRDEQAALRAKGIYRGIGVATFIKGTAPSPAGYYGAGGAPIVAQDACTLRLEPEGGVLCLVGVTDQGQGADTAMAQIAATAIGVPYEDVRVISGDTDATPYGGGTYASRATAICGEATYQAGRALRQEILSIAGQLLQTDPAALDISGGRIVDADGGAERMALSELGRIAHYQPTVLPNDVQPELQITRHFRVNDKPYIFTNGIHGAYVEVDPDTGVIRHLKHWVVEDCGRMVNPLLADEQVRGGAVQGLGGALYEHCIYDDAAQLQNATLADYLTPMAAEMPDIEVAHVQTPTQDSELGAKGAGESGTGAAPGVVMCAVNDALRPFNARVTEQPMTPEAVLKALGKV